MVCVRLKGATMLPVLALVACDGGAGDPAAMECTEQADGTCAPGATEGCWTWTAERVREGDGCYDGTFSTCTSGGLDAGAVITCWEVTHSDGTTARYVTGDDSHRFPSHWSVTASRGDDCIAAFRTPCGPRAADPPDPRPEPAGLACWPGGFCGAEGEFGSHPRGQK